LNDLTFHKAEIDATEIEAFVRKGFENKIGKDNVLGTRLFRYPDEFAVVVNVREENTDTLEIAHELQETLVNNNLAVIVYAKETRT
jgi:hypothetical protein